ncbi:hypothetical protein V8G54_002469 [Vigna mungo]|uniref:Uncharacterized protein n=1 Tax=Vigna mungo TaxID=3915 RepID=A0AAQ3P8W2_VIGMU
MSANEWIDQRFMYEMLVMTSRVEIKDQGWKFEDRGSMIEHRFANRGIYRRSRRSVGFDSVLFNRSSLPPTPIASTTTDLPFTSLPSNRRERDEEKGQQREAFPVQYISEGQNPKIGSLTVCSSNNPDAGSTPNHFNSSVEPHSVPYRGESPLQFCNKKQYFKIKQKDRKLTPKVLAPLQSFKLLSIQIKSNPPHASIRKQKRKGDRGGVEEGEGFGGG